MTHAGRPYIYCTTLGQPRGITPSCSPTRRKTDQKAVAPGPEAPLSSDQHRPTAAWIRLAEDFGRNQLILTPTSEPDHLEVAVAYWNAHRFADSLRQLSPRLRQVLQATGDLRSLAPVLASIGVSLPLTLFDLETILRSPQPVSKRLPATPLRN